MGNGEGALEVLGQVIHYSREYWRDRPVLLTGATGLVGSWVLELLLRLNADPVCLVRDGVPRSRAARCGHLAQATVVRGSLADHWLLERVINEYGVQTVIHLAAQTIVGIANRSPLSTFEANVGGTWKLLEACRHSPMIESIVVASSDKAYGRGERLPYDEGCALQGRHPYDVSKSCTDLIAQAFNHTYGLPITITRCGNFFGGGDLNFSRIVPGTIRAALRGEAPVLRSDGAMRRDYIYVEDAAEVYLMLAERAAKDVGVCGQAFNFAYEDPKSVLQLVEKILSAVGRSDLRPVVLGTAQNEIEHQYMSAEKARRWLGWGPRYTLEEGLERTVKWYREFLGNPTVREALLRK